MNILISILVLVLSISQFVVVFLSSLFKNHFSSLLSGDFFVFLCLIGTLNGITHILLITAQYLKLPGIQNGLILNQAYFSLATSCIALFIFAVKGFKWS